MNREALMTKEAIEYLRVSRITIYKLITEGKIKANKIGRDYRFLREDLNRFIRSEIEEKAVTR
ncbi:MAG: helix-turn-helix domain-containing protein [bacterium]